MLIKGARRAGVLFVRAVPPWVRGTCPRRLGSPQTLGPAPALPSRAGTPSPSRELVLEATAAHARAQWGVRAHAQRVNTAVVQLVTNVKNVQQGHESGLRLPCTFLGYFPKCPSHGPSVLEYLLGGPQGCAPGPSPASREELAFLKPLQRPPAPVPSRGVSPPPSVGAE